MASIASTSRVVTGGVDTHKDLHVAAVIDATDVVLGTAVFATTRAGYRDLVAWMRTYGDIQQIGVEGTGSYGAGLLRHLATAGIRTLEVGRPDRADRRRRGKDDTIDAENAAHAALAGRRVTTPKTRDGMVEALRALRTARTSAVKSRRLALQVLRAQIVSAPQALRESLRNLTKMRLIRTVAAWQPDPALARRCLELDDEIADLDDLITPLVQTLAPSLLDRAGFGVQNTAQLLVTCGDNPERIATEARFAKLCGVAPLPASSGEHTRHRLNRGGDRQANSALHLAVVTRIRTDDRTQDYIKRRTAEGKTKPEIIRCLKRYAAREAYHLIRTDRLQLTTQNT